ncbi:MAG TPA: tetratricopeptide repeat protein [Prolixibacteraceae bacterium]|nr:tetratricopeptide repeat protein [Prolixibacteraceae bacterium]
MAKKKQVEKSLFERIEQFLQSKSSIVLIASLLISLLFSILLFNKDVSSGGDDSGYIRNAYQFAKGLAFPGWHSSFYSMVLSLFVLIFGVNMVMLKTTSLLFNLASFYFIQRLFIKYTNHTTTTFVLLATAFSYLICYYSSTTYTESFFILFQIVYIYYFLEIAHKFEDSKESIKKSWKYFMVLGIAVYLLFQTKTVALSILVISIVYLLLNKKYLGTAIYTLSAIVTHFGFSLYKSVVWNVKKVGYEEQLETILLKHPYKPDQGNDNLIGFIQRIWDNSELYLSKTFVKMLGFFPTEYRKTSAILTILLLILFAISGFYAVKKNKKLLFPVLYLVGMIGATFVSIQKVWDQDRLIMIYFPFLIGIVAYFLYTLFEKQSFKKLQILLISFFALILITISAQSIKEVGKKMSYDKANTEAFNSYTPDWQNYMLASKWAGEHLPSNAVVLCRKPDMSWIASGGKNFFSGVYKLEANADSVLALVKRTHATHVIMANLRGIPTKKTDKTITTIRNNLIYLTSIKPTCLKTIKEFGTDEKAYIFEINLADQTPKEEYIQRLSAALIVNPKNVNLSNEIGAYLLSQNKPQEAYNYYEFALEYVKDAALYFNRGLCLFQMKKYKEASADFKKACEMKANFNQSWYNLALCYLYVNDFTNSKVALSKAKETGFADYESLERELMRH